MKYRQKDNNLYKELIIYYLTMKKKLIVTVERLGKSLEKSEMEIMNELPRDSSDRTIKLLSMLYDSAVSFLKSHSLKLSMPEGSISRALVEGKSLVTIKYFDYAIVYDSVIMSRR